MYICDMTHLYMRHDSYICATWLEKIECIRATWLQKTNDVTHVYVRHDAFICATWLEKILYTYSTWLNKKRTWLIYMCDLTRTYARSACSNSIWLLYEGVTTYCNTIPQKRPAIPQKRPTITNQQRALQFCEIWWLYLSDGYMKESKKKLDMTHSHVGHDSFICAAWLMSHILHIWMSHVAHINESCPTFEWVMSIFFHLNVQDDSCPTFKWVMSNLFWSDGYMKESKQCRTWLI